MRHRLGAALLLLVLTGCGQSASSGLPDVRVDAGFASALGIHALELRLATP